MIECDENINFDNQEYEEEYDEDEINDEGEDDVIDEEEDNVIGEEEDDVIDEEEEIPSISLEELQETASKIDFGKISKSRASSKFNDNVDKFDKLTDKINKLNNSKPIKVTKIKKIKFVPDGLTREERVSKSSARRSSSLVSSRSKTADLDKILEEQVHDENFELNRTNTPTTKTKKKKEIILPFYVKTKHSVSKKSSKISEYYSKKRSAPKSEAKTDVNGQMIDSNEIDSLKMMISIFLQLDEHCASLSEEARAFREEKKQYEEYILDIMEKCNRERVPHNDKVIKREVKEFRPKPKEHDILQTLITIFNDENVAIQVVKAINESVPLDEKIALKQEKPKVPKAVKRVKR